MDGRGVKKVLEVLPWIFFTFIDNIKKIAHDSNIKSMKCDIIPNQTCFMPNPNFAANSPDHYKSIFDVKRCQKVLDILSEYYRTVIYARKILMKLLCSLLTLVL